MQKIIGLIAGAGVWAALSALAQAPAAGPDKPETPALRHHERTPGSGAEGANLSRRPGEEVFGLFHKLNLTPEQTAQLKKIMEAKREQNKTSQESVMQLRRQLMEQMGSDDPDPEKLRALHREIAEVEGNLAVSRAEGLKEMKALLTPEQAEQLHKAMTGLRERLEQARKQWRERTEKGGSHDQKKPAPAPTT